MPISRQSVVFRGNLWWQLQKRAGTWTGTPKSEAGEDRLFAFLTTEPNAIVRRIRAKN